MLLDVGRHFFPLPFILKMLDVCALYKMNRFHWHLTEDQVGRTVTTSCMVFTGAAIPSKKPARAMAQGWRIEIKGFPRLTQYGAWRGKDEDSAYGGFYTQDQVRPAPSFVFKPRRHRTIGCVMHCMLRCFEQLARLSFELVQVRQVVRYAEERFITVVPEIELPGHCGAALACYPHLSCKDDLPAGLC